MFVLFDSCWYPLPRLGKQPQPRPHTHNSGWVQSPGILILKNPSAFPHLKAYTVGVLKRFAEDKRVVAWDLWNEPDNFDSGAPGRPGLEPANKPDLVNALLPLVFGWAREAKPSQPLTSGVWKQPESTTLLSTVKQIQLSHSDIISFHAYGNVASLELCIERLGTLKRPLMCTEYLARLNESHFEPHLKVMKERRVAAYNWGLVDGKTQTIYPWDSWTEKYTAEPTVWFHDILFKDGLPFRISEVDYIQSLTRSNSKPLENATAKP